MKKTLIISLLFFGVIYYFISQQLVLTIAFADTENQFNNYKVKSIIKLADGNAPDLSLDGRLIAYNVKIKNCFEVYLMNADGSNQHCITCDNVPKVILGKHKGKATFHPNGKYLLLGSENENGDHGLKTIPGIGDNYDLWIMDLEKNIYTRLTHLPANTAIQYPRFSNDGKKLMWSQRYSKTKGALFRKKNEFGFWKIMLADFIETDKGPELKNIIELEPGGGGYYEPHGFSQDKETIIFSGAISSEKSQINFDIFTFNMTTQKLINLTQSDTIHDEMSIYSPDGKKIALMSGTFVGWWPEFGYKTDLYLMNSDGSNRVCLTNFNDPNSSDYLGNNSQIAKISWSPEGNKIIFGIYIHKINKFHIYALNFEGAFEK